MKKLQKNFTTPEQSKRLLELGVPADSADMYYKHTKLTPYVLFNNVLFSVYSKAEDIIPCWSVGRLIDIIAICHGTPFYGVNKPYDLIDSLIAIIQSNVKAMSIDFSKLEE